MTMSEATEQLEIIIICRGRTGAGKSLAIGDMVAGLNDQGQFINIEQYASVHLQRDVEVVQILATLRRNVDHE